MAKFRTLANGKILATVDLGKDPDKPGARKRVSKCWDNKPDAQRWADGLQGDKARGLATPALTSATLADFLKETWLPLYRSKIEKRKCSTYNMESRITKWIIRSRPKVPHIGAKRLKDLTAFDLTKYYAALENDGMAYQSIRNMHSIIHRALQWAVDKDLLMKNPAAKADLPEPAMDVDNPEVIECLTLDQAQRFHAAALDDQYAAFWILLLDSGMRPGEAKALEWSHLDFDTGRVTVKQSLIHLHTPAERAKAGCNWRVKPLKTAKRDNNAARTFPLTEATLDLLRALKVQQHAVKQQAGDAWTCDHRFVFTQEDGQPLGPNLSHAWSRVMRAADKDGDLDKLGRKGARPSNTGKGRQAAPAFDPKFSIYTLRHTCATLLYEQRVSIEVIAQRLGNSVEICRRHYVRREREQTAEAPNVLAKLFTVPAARKLTLVRSA
jgi:integrase